MVNNGDELSFQPKDTQLVHKGDLEATIQRLLEDQRAVAANIREILPYVTIDSIKEGLLKRLKQSLEQIGALETGYIPIDGGYFTRVDTKSKWSRKWVTETLKTMPEAVKEAWERAKALGVFNAFAISAGGDPQLVGKAGKKNFLIGAWVNFEGGYSLGFRVRSSQNEAVPQRQILNNIKEN